MMNPEYTLVTTDYMNISTLGIGFSLFFYPTFGDLDNDGDEDMVLGEYSGYCYYFENTGGAGNAAIFSTNIILNDYLAAPLVTPTNAGIHIAPSLVDLDRDGDLDLAVGRRNGHINYYENIGTPASYSFIYLTNNLGGINVCEYWTIEGYAVPQFVDINGEYNLVVGSKTGWLYLYDDIEGNISTNFHLVDSTLDNIQNGTYSAPAIYDLNNDGRYEMVVGNARGGLALYKSADSSVIGTMDLEIASDIRIYPNPAKNNITVEIENGQTDSALQMTITVHEMSGRLIQELQSNEPKVIFNTAEWKRGTYLFRIKTEKGIVSKKVILI
ncbi:MAG: T9SS type A sorting domain-containing protein [Crocinitomicaceae bacterium]|nr:T9SS type A sorting domain-containing protein [Crocinitomicaceae bacterium]